MIVAAATVVAVGVIVAALIVSRRRDRLVERVLIVAAAERRLLLEAIVAKHSGDLARTFIAEQPKAPKVQVPREYLEDERAILEQLGEDPDVLVGVGSYGRPADPSMPRYPEGL